MKVLILHPHFTKPGGAGRFALEAALLLRKRGADVTVASIRSGPEIAARYPSLKFIDLGGPLSSELGFWLKFPLTVKKVNRIARELRPDILFSQVFPANWWGFLVKALNPEIKHVWMCQEPSAFIHSKAWLRALPFSAAGTAARLLNPFLKVIDKLLAKKADYIFGNSRHTRKQALDIYNYPPEVVGICYPGVDTARFKTDQSVPKIRGQLVVCGKLTKFKNVDKVIKAAALCIQKGQKLSLKIVGEGDQKEALKKLAYELFSPILGREDISEAADFSGSPDDAALTRIFQSAEALVHAADSEPFGLVPVEAMCCGTPVIAVKSGGPSETVIHLETGYLCESSDPSELSKAFEWILSDEHRLRQLSLNAAERGKEYSWQNTFKAIEEAFAALLK